MVVSTKHDIADGRAVLSEEHHHRYRIPLLPGVHSHPSSPRPTPPTGPNVPGSYFPSQPTSTRSSGDLSPLTTTGANTSASSVPVSGPSSHPDSRPGTSHEQTTSQPLASTSTAPATHIVNGVELPVEIDLEPSADVVTTLNITIPEGATPSHNLEVRFFFSSTKLNQSIAPLLMCSDAQMCVCVYYFLCLAYSSLTSNSMVDSYW